jgi:BirA family biotin operon repressor/biotin-[acetyl-CoA-carboxylase] ligase
VVPPNDIYIHERKVCGLLIETSYDAQKFKYAIVGIGINLNNDNFPADIADTATSISRELGHKVDSDELINSLEKKMESLYA